MSHPNEQQDSKRLINLLTQQRDYYLRLRELSEQQRTLISGGRPDQLLNILRERQTLVGSLARLNEQLAPFRRNWEGTYAGLPDDQRAQANNLLQEINNLLRVILRTDQEDSALLSARKQSVGQEIGAVSNGRAANTAYARQDSGPTSRSADVTG
ncbi:MAG: flagellar export chaperone FlgN [Planctomycetota bacterium]